MKDIGKWQWVRLIDVLFLGPFMVWYAIKTMPPAEEKEAKPSREYSWILLFFGITTILVNAYFYVKLG
jgi:uncharacterized Tic20 family protein